MALHPYGEVLPRHDNRVTVEHTPLDRYGVPIAHIEYKTGENERKMVAEMYDTAEEILHAAKAEILPFERGHLEPNGSAIHEHGTCHMGADPDGRKALEDLLTSQDKIITELAKGDPEALGDLQVLFEKIRRAAGSIDR